MKAAAWLALFLSASPLPAAQTQTRAEVKDQIKDTRQDLKQIQQQLLKNRQALKSQDRREKGLMGELEGLNRKLEGARREAKIHVKNLGLVEDRLARIRSRLSELTREEAEDRRSLSSSLVDLYKARSRRGPALLFGARSPSALADRVRYLGALSRATGQRVKGLRERIGQVSNFQSEFKERQAELIRSRKDVETARRRVEQERRRRQDLLQSVRSKKARIKDAVAELERGAGRLQGLLDDLQVQVARLAQARHATAPSAPGGPTTLRRGLAWPLRGRLVAEFGRHRHPVFKTLVFNRGIEIAAPHGSPVYAVAAGTVLHAAAMEGFGDLVVLDHGGGMMSVYGYNSQVHVQVGQGVAQGDLVADVGEAGASGQPSLYFEIRKGAKALDPFTYLRRR